MRPLDGITVLDVSIAQQGPVATAMLADFGADVIKVEPRGTGDAYGRGMMRIIEAMSGVTGENFYFENNNRGKRSLTLDLKKDRGKEVLFRLVAKADVFVQNFRQGVVERLGVDYAALSAINPRLVYCSIGGYGAKGPDSGKTSLDVAAQARSGIMFAAREPGPPTTLTGGFADQVGAIVASYAILMALMARERHGIGQHVITSHLGSMICVQGLALAGRLMIETDLPKKPRKETNNPLWNHYEARDGRWFMLAMVDSDPYWPRFCTLPGLEHLEKDPRFETAASRSENAEQLVSVLDSVFATKTRDEWIELFWTLDLIADRVQDYDDLIADPQPWANHYFAQFEHPRLGATRVVGVPFELTRTPGDPRSPAPELGAHTHAILSNVGGYTRDEIERLREEEVI